MPQRRAQQGDQQSRAAVVRAPASGNGEGPQRALVAVTQEIDNRLAIIGASSAAGIRPDRLKLVALTAFTRTPALWTCDPVSVARAIVEAGQLGLEPTGLMGGAYLVPRGGQATLLVGYRGLVMLAMRSQLVQRVEARVVRERDTFDYGYGLDPYLTHKPSQEADPGPYTGAYAVIHYRDGAKQFDYMSIAEIEAIRKRSGSPNAGPWVTDYAEMCKKTPLRRLMKMAPLTVEVAAKLDELDPEVPHEAEASAASTRQAELRAQLQRALDAEQGVTEGEYREEPATQATAQPPASGPSAAPANGAPREAPEAAAEPPAAAGVPLAPAAATKPESVGEILGADASSRAEASCRIRSEKLRAGPCILPVGHEPANEHEEAGGARWSQPPEERP